MTRPGFRRSSTGGLTGAARAGASQPIGGAPFSQAQILHLMKTEFGRARRYRYPLSCLLVEVDRLQPLADIHGLELRDVVRRELGKLVAEKTRGHDHVGLISEDRFLLVLPHTAALEARVVAERIRAGFAELEVGVQGGILPLSLSVGVAACEDHETLFFDTLVSQAEVALEWAMQDGGDQAVQFHRDRFAGPEVGESR